MNRQKRLGFSCWLPLLVTLLLFAVHILILVLQVPGEQISQLWGNLFAAVAARHLAYFFPLILGFTMAGSMGSRKSVRVVLGVFSALLFLVQLVLCFLFKRFSAVAYLHIFIPGIHLFAARGLGLLDAVLYLIPLPLTAVLAFISKTPEEKLARVTVQEEIPADPQWNGVPCPPVVPVDPDIQPQAPVWEDSLSASPKEVPTETEPLSVTPENIPVPEPEPMMEPNLPENPQTAPEPGQAPPSPEASQQAPGPLFCAHCGSPMEQEDRFCRRCGAAAK